MVRPGPVRPVFVIPLAATLAAAATSCGHDLTRPATGGSAVRLQVIVQPTATRAGEAIGPAVAVEVLDSAGRRTAERTAVRVRLAEGTGKAHAHLSGVTDVAAVDGVASFATLAVDSAAVGYRLSVTAPGLDSTVTDPFNVAVGPAASLAFVADPEGVTAGSFVAPAIRVRVRDRGGNFVPSATNPITLSIGANPVGGSLTGAVTRAAVAGIATFADLKIDKAGDGYTLTASARGLAGGTTTVFPVTVPVSQVSGGGGHTCALTDAGVANCWGYGYYGELGDGTTGYVLRTSPAPVAGGHAFAAISAGYYYTCAVTADGAAYCWGNNYSGQLGDGTTGSRSRPVAVLGGNFLASISAGGNHSCALATSGVAYCWGYNNDGELGNGTYTDSHAPVPVSGGLSFSAVFVGGSHTCGLSTTEAAYCWGDGYAGQLGQGGYSDAASPVAVSGGLRFTSLALGSYHTCGLASGGQAYCWGDNYYGELGAGALSESATPVPVSTSLQFIAISAQGDRTAAVATDGTAWGWGFGLGRTPVPMASDLRFRAIEVGDTSCGLTSNGALYCWRFAGSYDVHPWTEPQRVLVFE